MDEPIANDWLAGFTDGEGCFTVQIRESRHMACGWQVSASLVLTQSTQSLQALIHARNILRCGSIANHPARTTTSRPISTLTVKSLHSLANQVIPYFDGHPLKTAKRDDYARWRNIVQMMTRAEHLKLGGVITIAMIASNMNRKLKPGPLRHLTTPPPPAIM